MDVVDVAHPVGVRGQIIERNTRLGAFSLAVAVARRANLADRFFGVQNGSRGVCPGLGI